MDNEEIRELLKELKESSDESSAVRSRVVKIHFDTPQEAERRERARRKAAEAARQKALEEEEERRAEEEARREAAEKEAEAVVAEAKAEAAAEFSADLGKDLLSQETGEDDELSDAADLHFNWEYKYRRLSEESPAPADGEVLSGTDEKERPSGKGKSTAGEADEEEPDDQEDWKRRMEESPDGSRKKASFKGLSGRLPGLKSIKGRIQSRRAKDAEEEEEPEAEADRPEEISEDFETDPVSSGKRRGRKAAESKTPESRLSESRASESKTSEARKKRIAAPDQDDFESDADYFRDDEPEEKREKKASAGRASALFAGAAGVLASLKGAVSGKGSGDRKRGKKTEEDDFPDELPVEGEEKGRAYDGNPVIMISIRSWLICLRTRRTSPSEQKMRILARQSRKSFRKNLICRKKDRILRLSARRTRISLQKQRRRLPEAGQKLFRRRRLTEKAPIRNRQAEIPA